MNPLRNMRKRFGAIVALALLAGCGSLPLTPEIITATPDPRTIIITITDSPTADPRAGAFATLTAIAGTGQPVATTPATPVAVSTTAPDANTAVAAVNTPGAVPAASLPAIPATVIATSISPTPGSPVVATFNGPSPTPNAFPTDTRMQVFIAQEDFQGGYMFWMQSSGTMWVLLPEKLPNPGDALTIPTNGQWRIYKDEFAEGQPETDPALTPPEGRFQPRRGFGKLWRENPELRTALGWATTPEFALTTSYVYQPGGSVDGNGNYTPGPGKHFLVTLGRTTFEFTEPQPGQPFGTWRRVG
jgi:hypothetical protein